MASRSSPAGRSAAEAPSSPVHLDKSFATTSAAANATEDEDNDTNNSTTRNTSRKASMTDVAGRPEMASSGGIRFARNRSSASGTGGSTGGHGSGTAAFKDPSAIGKIRHLKKEDGEPLWRADIQYDFLRAVFDDETRVFTNNYEDKVKKQCFADLYIDTMARSSKTSKILHDKLLSDREAAKSMAMVCLLVNIGRMNTTLNFFPEMRAQLRTYHAIPSLQVDENPTDYKQLQDAPRLKSILKGGTEDQTEPRSLDLLKDMDVPRTNPVNLLFLICNRAPKVAELHFPPSLEFHDLIMKSNFSSKSRARAFLWIMWFYLESDFTEEGCDENPFGPGVDYGVDVANQGVPRLVELTPEEEALENVDTSAERQFGLARKELRARILHGEQVAAAAKLVRPSPPSLFPNRDNSVLGDAADGETDNEPSERGGILPRIRPPKLMSDLDLDSGLERVRSMTPPRLRSLIVGAEYPHSEKGANARRAGPLKNPLADGASPARRPPLLQQLHQQQQLQQSGKKKKLQRSGRGHDNDDDDTVANTSVAPSRKPRPPTAHQIAVENNRKQRIEYLLSRGMYRKYHRARKARRNEGAIIRALQRLDKVEDPFEDSENEDSLQFNRGLFSFQPGAAQNMPTGTPFRERGFFGLVQLSTETDDFGEQISSYAASVRRTCRRMNRWEAARKAGDWTVKAPIKRPRVDVPADDDYKDPNETEDEQDLDGADADADVSMSMSLLETPAPPAKKRRTTAAATPASARARGGRGTKAAGSAAAGTPASSNRRRRPVVTAGKAAAANGDVDEDGDTALASGAEGDGGGDMDVEDADETEVASVVVKPRVTIKKSAARGSKAAAAGRSGGRAAVAKIKREAEEEENGTVLQTGGNGKGKGKGGMAGDEDEDEDDEENVPLMRRTAARATAGDDEEDELNDVDKTLLGMGDGDSGSE